MELQQVPCHEPARVEDGNRLGTKGETDLDFVPKVLVGTRTDTDETLVVPKHEGERSRDVGI